MLNFFSLCRQAFNPKIKPREIAIQVFNSEKPPQINTDPQNQAPSPLFGHPNSLNQIIEPKQKIKSSLLLRLDPNVLTPIVGDQSTHVKTIQKSNYEELNQSLIQKKQKFTDPEFPPNNNSLGNDSRLHKSVKKWVRITELYKNPVFFAQDVDSNDVFQGYFYGAGNCYFMSALSNLARNPSRIKKIFGTTEVSKEGIYYAKLFHKGHYTQIIVDDLLPVSSSGPLFARPPQGSSQIWVQILEKCFAKLCGSYKDMNAGLPSEAYYALTGFPTFFYQIDHSKQELQKNWSIVLQSYNKNYCIDCGTPVDLDQSKWLRQNHAYTLLGAYELQSIKLIKLRNPMGKFEWIGRASDYDLEFWNKVSPNDKQKIGFKVKDDGIFFMLWEDFSTYFLLFEVCQFKDNANLLSIRSNFPMKGANIFELQTQEGEVIVSLVQDTKRGTGVDLRTYKYSKSYFVISKLTVNSKGQRSYKIVRMAGRSKFFAHHQRLNLEPGTYIIYSKYQWANDSDNQASFIAYSNSQIRIRQANMLENPNYLQKTFMQVAYSSAQFNEPNSEYSFVKRFYALSGGFGFYAAKVSKSAQISITIEIDQQYMLQRHLILKRPYRDMGLSKINLKPGEQVIVVFSNKDYVIPDNFNIPDPKIKVNS